MSGEPEGLVLVFLRRLDGKMDRLTDEVAELKSRMTLQEPGLVNVRSEILGLHQGLASQQVAFDRISTRLDRIERRLDLHEAHQ